MYSLAIWMCEVRCIDGIVNAWLATKTLLKMKRASSQSCPPCYTPWFWWMGWWMGGSVGDAVIIGGGATWSIASSTDGDKYVIQSKLSLTSMVSHFDSITSFCWKLILGEVNLPQIGHALTLLWWLEANPVQLLTSTL